MIMETQSNLKERYVHAMVLSGVGDALGYKNGEWEFCHSGIQIKAEVQKLGGLENILVRLPKFSVSDDTVMHLATAEALTKAGPEAEREKLFSLLAAAYKDSMKDMAGRAPGMTCMGSTHKLKPAFKKGYQIPFNPRGGGCGAAMRAMCIGLRYPRPEQLDDLIAVGIESGRMTHHHPTGYLGALAAALFTSFAVQGKPVISWGKALLDILPQALSYVTSSGHCAEENKSNWGYFTEKWTEYLKLRGLSDGTSQPVFPEKYGFAERDKFVKSVSFSGWGGSSGHDAPMIAYDAFLAAGDNWHELCNRAMFHAGDSDSTGVIAACWYGTIFGVDKVPVFNYKAVEYKTRLEKVGKLLYALAFPQDASASAEDDARACAPLDESIDELDEIDDEMMNTQEMKEVVEANNEHQNPEQSSEAHPKNEGSEPDSLPQGSTEEVLLKSQVSSESRNHLEGEEKDKEKIQHEMESDIPVALGNRKSEEDVQEHGHDLVKKREINSDRQESTQNQNNSEVSNSFGNVTDNQKEASGPSVKKLKKFFAK